MKKNVGNLDRAVRLLLAMAIIILFFAHYFSGVLGIVLLIVAGIFLLTGLAGTCPLYSLFGINSCKLKKAE